MTDQSQIERVVMRRVRAIRVLRPIFSATALAALISLIALYLIGREVWVAMVFRNAPAELALLPRFYLAAFDHTRLMVQALTLLTLASVLYLARECARLVTAILSPALA